jgi:hypothetical protein
LYFRTSRPSISTPALGRVEQVRNQADERRLAGTGETDERHHLSGLGRKGDVAEHLRAIGIRKADPLETDIAFDRRRLDRVRRVDRFRHQPEHLAHALGAGNRTLQLTGRVSDGGQRSVDGAEIVDDDVQVADAERPGHDEPAADDDDERGTEDRDRADDDGKERLLPGDRDARVHRLLARAAVPIELVALAGETLDQPHRAECLVEPLEQLRFELLDPFLAVGERRRVIPQAEEQERHHRQRQQGDRDVEAQDHAEHHRQRDDRGCERKDAAHHQVLDRVGVDVDAIDGVGRALVNVVMQPKPGEVLEQAVPEVVHHPLTGIDLHLGPVRGDELVDDLQDHAGGDDADQQRQPIVGRQVRQPGGEGRVEAESENRDVIGKRLPRQHVVDDDRERPRLQRPENDLGQEQDRQHRHAGAIRPEELQRPAQQAPLGGLNGSGAHPPTLRPGVSARGAISLADGLGIGSATS